MKQIQSKKIKFEFNINKIIKRKILQILKENSLESNNNILYSLFSTIKNLDEMRLSIPIDILSKDKLKEVLEKELKKFKGLSKPEIIPIEEFK